MQYYVIPATGTGSDSDPIQPNAQMSSWVGQNDTSTNTFLIATNNAVSGYTPLTMAQLQTECTNRGLDYSDVLTWSVG